MEDRRYVIEQGGCIAWSELRKLPLDYPLGGIKTQVMTKAEIIERRAEGRWLWLMFGIHEGWLTAENLA